MFKLGSGFNSSDEKALLLIKLVSLIGRLFSLKNIQGSDNCGGVKVLFSVKSH
jgi:hypothetical protein